MTPERAFSWFIMILGAVVLIVFLVWLVDRVDDDNGPGYVNPSAFVAGLE